MGVLGMNKDQFERVALGIIIASLLYVPTQLCNGSRCVSAGWNFIFTTEYSVDFIKLLIEEIIIGLLLFYLWRNKSKIKSKKPSIKSQFWPNVWKSTKKVYYGFAIVFVGRLGFMLGLAIQGIILGLISAGIAAYFMSSLIRFIAIKFYKSDIHSTYFEEGKLFTSTKKFFWIAVSVCIALPFITNYDDFKDINSESRVWFNNLNISNPLSAIDTSTFVKNISLGDTKKDVLNKLGYPLSIRVGNDILTGEDAEVYIDDLTHQDMDAWKYMFANHFITINSNPYTKYITGLEHAYVSEVRCEHREGKFVDPDDTYCPYLGIDLFTKQEKVINQLGNPDGNLFKSIADKQFYYSKLGVTLTIKDNQVVAIGLHKILKK
jgi:hypothetical protein